MTKTRRTDEETKEIVRENLVVFRKLRNLKQEDIAQVVGRTKSAIGAWERGISTPDVSALFTLSEHFNIPINAFYEKDGFIGRKPQVEEKDISDMFRIGMQKTIQGRDLKTGIPKKKSYDTIFDFMEEPGEKGPVQVDLTRKAAEELRDATLAYAKKLTEIIEKMDG